MPKQYSRVLLLTVQWSREPGKNMAAIQRYRTTSGHTVKYEYATNGSYDVLLGKLVEVIWLIPAVFRTTPSIIIPLIPSLKRL